MKVLVTGGLGYIGSHTAVALLEKGYEVVIIDNLLNTHLEVLDSIQAITNKKPIFVNLDLRIKSQVESFFEAHQNIEALIHFAASKAVGESVAEPLFYYENNVSSLIYVLQNLLKQNHPKMIFSSSCTVYGEAKDLPISEKAPVKTPNSPYGNTKQIGEEIITDTAKVSELQAILLRYFNPIGAHPSALIGELPLGVPQNLVPFISQTAAGLRDSLLIYGDDYGTTDGTGVRDYIHVMDLAEAHVIALERLLNGKNDESVECFNLGTGKGSSVLEVIRTFESVNDLKLPYKIVDRRPGDVAAAYADTENANSILGWTAQRTLADALKDTWAWQKSLM